MLKYAENKDKNDKPPSPEEDRQVDSVAECVTLIVICCDNRGGGQHHKQYKVKLYDIITLQHLSSVNFK